MASRTVATSNLKLLPVARNGICLASSALQSDQTLPLSSLSASLRFRFTASASSCSLLSVHYFPLHCFPSLSSADSLSLLPLLHYSPVFFAAFLFTAFLQPLFFAASRLRCFPLHCCPFTASSLLLFAARASVLLLVFPVSSSPLPLHCFVFTASSSLRPLHCFRFTAFPTASLFASSSSWSPIHCSSLLVLHCSPRHCCLFTAPLHCFSVRSFDRPRVDLPCSRPH